MPSAEWPIGILDRNGFRAFLNVGLGGEEGHRGTGAGSFMEGGMLSFWKTTFAFCFPLVMLAFS